MGEQFCRTSLVLNVNEKAFHRQSTLTQNALPVDVKLPRVSGLSGNRKLSTSPAERVRIVLKRRSAGEPGAVSAPPPASDPAPHGFLLTPGKHVLRRDVANRAVQANVVVMLDVAATRRRVSSSDNGVPGRMHSPLSDLCHRSIFPFDWG